MSEDELIRFVAETEYQDIPEETREYTKHLAMKTAAGTLAGTQQPTGRKVASYVSGKRGNSEEAGVIGCGFKTSLEDAVFANGTFCHASELEDDKIYPQEGVSWDITTFPLTLSLAEKYRLSGEEFITASAISLEVLARLQLPPTRGSTVDLILQSGSAAAAAAAAKAMRLTEEQIRHAMGIAWAGGFVFMQHTGSDAHFLDSAFQCVRGLRAAELAKEGLGGEPDIQAMFDALYKEDSIDAERTVEDLGEEWRFRGIGVKKYPCCYYTHRYIDAFKEMLDEHDLNADTVGSIELEIGPVADEYVNRPDPQTPEDAKFSLQHLLGAVLVDGDIDYPQLTEAAISDPKYRDAREKVSVVVDERENVPLAGTATVRVTDREGTVYENEREHLRGVNEKDPLTDEEFRDLYRKFAGPVLDAELVEQTADEFLALEDQQDMQLLLDSLTYR
jgi:2-methylcitrate dehydratase PrpD